VFAAVLSGRMNPPQAARASAPPTLIRFEARGYTPGAYEPAPETLHPEFPLMLDPRRRQESESGCAAV